MTSSINWEGLHNGLERPHVNDKRRSDEDRSWSVQFSADDTFVGEEPVESYEQEYQVHDENCCTGGNSYENAYQHIDERGTTTPQHHEPQTQKRVMEERESVKEPSALTQLNDYSPGNLFDELERKKNSLPEHLLPRLNVAIEKQLAKNVRELSIIEGNLADEQSLIQSIYISSCFRGEGRTTGAVNTAFGLAVYGGRKVLLIDANYHSPQVHRFFQTDYSPGAQDVLQLRSTFLQSIQPTCYNGLFILPSNGEQSNPNIDSLEDFMTICKNNFDYIIIDGQPIMSSSNFAQFSKRIVDRVVLVVECEKTKWEVVQLAQKKLQNAGVTHMGVILNKRKYYIPRYIYRFL